MPIKMVKGETCFKVKLCKKQEIMQEILDKDKNICILKAYKEFDKGNNDYTYYMET